MATFFSRQNNNNDSDAEDPYDSLCSALRQEIGSTDGGGGGDAESERAHRNRAVAKFITRSAHGDAGTLELLLKSGAELAKPVLDANLDDNGWLPIHAACQMGFIEVYALLSASELVCHGFQLILKHYVRRDSAR